MTKAQYSSFLLGQEIAPGIPAFDLAQAYQEGWTLEHVQNTPSDANPVVLLGLDEDRIDDDIRALTNSEAIRHVSKLAQSGSIYHQAVMAYLQRYSPTEYDMIMKYSKGLSLDDFVRETHESIELFAADYRKQAQLNPEQYPLCLNEDNAGLWFEFFSTFDPQAQQDVTNADKPRNTP